MVLALALVALSGYALADLVCDGSINVDPGEPVVLNGTFIPDDDKVDVWYGWTFSNGTVTDYPIYNSTEDLIGQPLDNAYLNFSAPNTPYNCYTAYLSVYTNKTYTTEDDLLLAMTAPCINMSCYSICVNEYNCSNCSDIFCDYNCSDFPTDTSTYCPDWNASGNKLCYKGEQGSTVVRWYIVTEDYYNSTMGYDPYHLAGLIADKEGYCINETDYEWCTRTQGVYKIIMAVWSKPENVEGDEELFFACLSGTVVQVESPEAEIAHITT